MLRFYRKRANAAKMVNSGESKQVDYMSSVILAMANRLLSYTGVFQWLFLSSVKNLSPLKLQDLLPFADKSHLIYDDDRSRVFKVCGLFKGWNCCCYLPHPMAEQGFEPGLLNPSPLLSTAPH